MEQKILYNNQYGFRPGCSTTIAATEMIQEIQKSLDDGNLTCVVFLDISKAFDTVKHDILMRKLALYGVRGNTLEIIKDYFTNRAQYTTVNDVPSDSMNLNYGVIQGEVLASLLFMLYINDIGMLKLHGRIFTYADDTAIVYDVYDRQKVQKDLDMIADYFRINVLSINSSKTSYMLIRSPYTEIPSVTLPLTINDTQITLVKESRYLGLYIDENLNWKSHVQRLSKEISRPIGVINKLKHKLNKKTLELIYHSLIHSKVSYMIAIWGSAKKYVKKKIYTLQNRALKIIHKLPFRFPTRSLYDDIEKHILPIEKVYMKALIVFVHQCLFDLIHHTIIFERVETRRTRAMTHRKLKTHRMRTERYGKEGIMNRGLTYYNDIPVEIKQNSNINIFKRLVQQHLQQQQTH